ncbi:uncharacterized protein SPPG_03643 [Spizellomyces punctatus DAOM BR117]|uniref:RED-like N-terminal domain-containing protein n=1 Tax=Spizellomyces punctatus (strain DAOM BR117) TaxID=645134 RepID=A0A0L0HLB9_SPIPD|nr:uncharacterized protein SPPG_03643 [Spizellomyces punctatus DAOM BR117]KND01853.1 hypothetical protein SPPG_03643 [Spizellomyces punctatus DAOM BR117]|eukprot:XP_016609892.1 hypothetical protein SPPG_03643 [Spizellomyces punctatus DAOM BR117]
MSKGLGQDDFRKLLATPRSVLQQTPRAAQTPRQTPRATKDADGFAQPAPVKSKKKLWKPPSKEGASQSDNGPGYRDRARERREGANPDYEETEQMLAVLKASEQSQNADRTETDTSLSIEQSKYLGGDAKHTHLVKGLDYALLEKVQRELQQKDAEEKKEEEAIQYVEQIHGDGGSKFNSTFAANIYELAVKKAKVQPPLRNELFIPGRLAFAWELGTIDETGDYIGTRDIPTSVMRSRADVKGYDRNFTISGSDLVIEKVASVVAYLREGSGTAGANPSGKRRVKRKDKEKGQAQIEKVEEPGTAKQAQTEEEDIFADAGREYTFQVEDRGRRPADRVVGMGEYFDSAAVLMEDNKEASDGMDLDVIGPESGNALSTILQESAGMLDSLQGDGAAKKMVGSLQTAGGAKMPTDLEQPSTGSTTGHKRQHSDLLPASALDDVQENHLADLADLDDSASDAEGADLNQMDLGVRQNKRKQLTRFDFDTDEEWQKYKDKQVHLPKAAFQFGIKASDGRQKSGRKGGEGSGKKKNHDAKLNREFQQLNKVFTDKYGTGLEDSGGGRNKKQKRGK